MMRFWLLAGMIGLAGSAAAQTPPAGVLTLPSRTKPAAPSAPPHANAAPVGAVHQVTPFAPGSVLGQSAPGHRTPVVQPPPHLHPQKAPPPKPAAPAKPPVTAIVPPAAAPTAPPAAPPDPAKGSVTGLPLPRFVALRADEVNMRSGPGTRYPIEWQYHRRDLPVEVEREFDVWRLIADEDGTKGWVNQATLVARRSFEVKDAERTLRHSAAADAAPVALLKPGVIGRIRGCAQGQPWCEVQVGDYRGFLRRDEIWGTYPDELVAG